jgi:urease accessory protein
MDTGAPPERADDGLSRLRLLQLVSPSLPIGAFAYSRGLEKAVELGWARDELGARAWITGLMEHQLARLDAPVLARMHRALAEGDLESARRWAEWLEAFRETHELREESRAMGRTLARLLRDLGLATPTELAPLASCHLACFALAAVRLGLDTEATLDGALWAFLEGQTTAAVKLVPLGQTAGQRMMLSLATSIPALRRLALSLDDDAIGSALPGLALASALHETQHTRLFRS